MTEEYCRSITLRQREMGVTDENYYMLMFNNTEYVIMEDRGPRRKIRDFEVGIIFVYDDNEQSTATADKRDSCTRSKIRQSARANNPVRGRDEPGRGRRHRRQPSSFSSMFERRPSSSVVVRARSRVWCARARSFVFGPGHVTF